MIFSALNKIFIYHTVNRTMVCFKLIQWNSSCEATPFVAEMWPFKRGGLSSGVEISTFMLRFTLSSGLSRGVGLSSGWSLKRGSTVYENDLWYIFSKLNQVYFAQVKIHYK